MKLKRILCVLTVALALLAPNLAAMAIDTGLDQTGTAAFGTEPATSIPNIVRLIIDTLLGLIGVYLMLLFFYGGYQWMSAGGDAKQVQSAKDRLKNATIGLLIILASWSISGFILTSLISATS